MVGRVRHRAATGARLSGPRDQRINDYPRLRVWRVGGSSTGAGIPRIGQGRPLTLRPSGIEGWWGSWLIGLSAMPIDYRSLVRQLAEAQAEIDRHKRESRRSRIRRLATEDQWVGHGPVVYVEDEFRAVWETSCEERAALGLPCCLDEYQPLVHWAIHEGAVDELAQWFREAARSDSVDAGLVAVVVHGLMGAGASMRDQAYGHDEAAVCPVTGIRWCVR